MKHSKILLAGLLILVPVYSTLAATKSATGCEAKRQNIEQQIVYAAHTGITIV